MILSRVIAKRIVEPINDLDLDDSEAEEPYHELAPLVTKIRQQNHRIQRQLEEMEREQKEFKEITNNMGEGFLLLDKNLEILSFNKAAIELLGYGDEGVRIWHLNWRWSEELSNGDRRRIERQACAEPSGRRRKVLQYHGKSGF